MDPRPDEDDVIVALAIFREAGVDPKGVNVPAMAAAEGKTCREIAERVVRAHKVANGPPA